MIKKGQWVEFKLNDGTHKGCVISGGKTIKVAFGHNGNSYRTVKASPHHFNIVPTPNLDDSGIMDAYELKSYKEAGGEETIRFEAKLHKNGKLIAIVSNGGFGASNDYYPTMKGTWEDIIEYNETVKQWAIHYGDEKPFEPENNWISWVTTGKPTGQSAKLFWDDHHEYMSKWSKK